MRNKKNKWLLYATSACLTCGIVGAVTLNQNESVKAFAESTAVDIAQMYICDAAYTGSDNDNTLGADNAFDLNVLSAVIPGSHYIHNDDTYRSYAKSVYEYDITFQLEFSDWGDEGWFGFKNSDYWETRIYNDKAMIYWDMPTYGGASAETAFSQEILGGYHTIRMALDCSDEKVSGDNYLWTYTLTIDDATYTTTCVWANWSSGHYFEMRNMTGKPVNVISTNSQLPPDISDLAISNNEIGTSGSETAFDFTKVTSVATGAHYIHTNKDYGAWEANAQKIDVRFSMEVVDWSDDAWFGLQTSSFYDLRIYKDKVRLIFTHQDYYGQYDVSVNLATPLSNGWHDINLKLNPVDAGGGVWVIIMTAYVDGRIATPAAVAPNWSSNAYKLVNETGKAVNVLSSSKYYVAFDANGGEAVENVYANRGDAVSALPTPVNGIKVFEGWYSSADFAEGMKVESISALTSNRTLYAMWSDPITYTVTYEENGGDAIEDAIVVEGNAVVLPMPVKGTKIFDGWYSSADFAEGTKVEGIDAITADITLYAKWLNPKYTVVFEENGAEAVEDVTAEEGSAVALPTPVKGTKIFDGWYSSADFAEGTKVESIDALMANMTLYAKWLNPKYTVTFEENGAETVEDITAEEGSAVTLPTPVKGTKIFDGWYSSADFAEGTKVEGIESLAADTTLYAKWSTPKYTVTFEENGGEAVEDITVEEGSAVTLPTPVNGTKIFDGWYISAEFSEWAKVENIDSLTADMTLYAKWLNPTYTVTFEENGAETVADITAEEGSTVALPTPVNGTKIFDGWYSSADFAEGTKVESIDSLTADMTLYAKWSEPAIEDGSNEDTSSEDGSDEVVSLFAGCFGSVGSAMSFSVLLGAAALVLKKKKDE